MCVKQTVKQTLRIERTVINIQVLFYKIFIANLFSAKRLKLAST